MEQSAMEFSEDIVKYMCCICQELLSDPVVLPCDHTACLYCLEKTLDYTKYQCFLCRRPIQSWYRRTRRNNRLVNEELRDEIREKFAELTAKKLKGESLDLPVEYPKVVLSDPGEIGQDFELERTKWQQELEKEHEKEIKLSEEYIKNIEEEENRKRLEEEERIRKDEEVARALALEYARQLDEKNGILTQVNTDEALAKEWARNDFPYLLSPKIKNLRKRTTSNPKYENETFSNEKTKPKLFLDQQSDVIDQLPPNGSLTKKLTNTDLPAWRSKLSPKVDKSKKKRLVSKYGPMDRFLETKRTHTW